MSTSRWRMRLARFLRVKPVCNAVFWLRLQYFFRLRRRLQVYGDPTSIPPRCACTDTVVYCCAVPFP